MLRCFQLECRLFSTPAPPPSPHPTATALYLIRVLLHKSRELQKWFELRMPANRGHFVMLLLRSPFVSDYRFASMGASVRSRARVYVWIKFRLCNVSGIWKAYENFNVNYYHCNMAVWLLYRQLQPAILFASPFHFSLLLYMLRHSDNNCQESTF